ncbi:MAG: hypothetical protein H6907_09365 [Hyphomicrobiales bacterium]|nr:hypothetical protein [Hyphomicrobiales bacterium]
MAAVGILLALVAGCSSFGAPGAPDRSFDEAQDIAQLEQEFQTAASIKGFYASGQTVDDRNRFIIGRLVLTDVHYIRFIRQFAVNKALIDSAVDIATIGVDLAVTLVGAAPTKAILGAVSGGLTSSKVSIDKNFFQEKTVPVLVGEMNAQRKHARIPLVAGMHETMDKYPFEQAVIDLQAYYEAGTFIGALHAIQKESGVREQEADGVLDVILARPVPTALQVRRKAAAAYVRTLDQAQLDQLASALGLPTGGSAKSNILRTILKAQSTPSFDVIADKLNTLFGKKV